MTQATGQSPFPLEIAGIDKFNLLPLELKFNSMKVNQNSLYSREGKSLFSQKINNRRQNFKKRQISWRFSCSTFTSNYLPFILEFVGLSNAKFQNPISNRWR
jgi:hypothetical protein